MTEQLVTAQHQQDVARRYLRAVETWDLVVERNKNAETARVRASGRTVPLASKRAATKLGTQPAVSAPSGAATGASTYRCGNDLPPCYVMMRESGGNIYAVEPSHRGAPYGDPGDPWNHASGKWQIMPGTWAGFDGYPYAAAAPESVQDARARQIWAGGAGCAQWTTC